MNRQTGSMRRIRVWLGERLGIRALTYPVPEHANGILCTLGGITLVGFLVLILSGIYLAQFYDPDPALAHASVGYIAGRAPFGEFVRGVHYWTALAVSVTVGLHLFRVFLSGAYKAPRELNWLVGLGLLAVTMGFVFTGTVVKWDQEGIEALVHNEAAARLLGGIGAWFSPRFSLSVPLLVRVYFAHVAILPALFTVLIAAHVYFIKVHGMAPRGRADGRETDPAIARADPAALYGEPMQPFTDHLRQIVGWGALLTAMVMSWAIAFPPRVGPAPVSGIEVTKPPFLFWWLYAVEDVLGIRGLLVTPLVFFLLLATVPFVDRGRFRAMHRRRRMIIAGLVVVGLVIALSAYTRLTPPVAHTEMK